MKKPAIIILSFVAAVILLVVIFILKRESPDIVLTNAKTIDKNLLVGNWLRTDAGYRILISKINDNGSLEANTLIQIQLMLAEQAGKKIPGT